MNMGGPADHWYTDIFSWKRQAFGEPIDSLIKDIVAGKVKHKTKLTLTPEQIAAIAAYWGESSRKR